MSKLTRVVLVATAAVSAVSVQGKEYEVVDGVVQADEEETLAIAADLAPHGFVLQSREIAEAPSPPVELKAEHRSQGRWAVMRGDVKVFEGLDKEQAAEFNAQTPEDREKLLALALNGAEEPKA